MDYPIPRAGDLPLVETVHMEGPPTPARITALIGGARGRP